MEASMYMILANGNNKENIYFQKLDTFSVCYFLVHS